MVTRVRWSGRWGRGSRRSGGAGTGSYTPATSRRHHPISTNSSWLSRSGLGSALSPQSLLFVPGDQAFAGTSIGLPGKSYQRHQPDDADDHRLLEAAAAQQAQRDREQRDAVTPAHRPRLPFRPSGACRAYDRGCSAGIAAWSNITHHCGSEHHCSAGRGKLHHPAGVRNRSPPPQEVVSVRLPVRPSGDRAECRPVSNRLSPACVLSDVGAVAVWRALAAGLALWSSSALGSTSCGPASRPPRCIRASARPWWNWPGWRSSS
jgi:hypothetical protein